MSSLNCVTKVLVYALIVTISAMFSVEVSAQEKLKVSWRTTGENNKYTKRHVIEVADVPGHAVVIFEIHRTYPADTGAVYDGVKVKEELIQGTYDGVAGNGLVTGYSVLLLENGDNIYARWQQSSQTVPRSDGPSRASVNGTWLVTGGSGKFRGIQGVGRFSGWSEPGGALEIKGDGEYWTPK